MRDLPAAPYMRRHAAHEDAARAAARSDARVVIRDAGLCHAVPHVETQRRTPMRVTPNAAHRYRHAARCTRCRCRFAFFVIRHARLPRAVALTRLRPLYLRFSMPPDYAACRRHTIFAAIDDMTVARYAAVTLLDYCHAEITPPPWLAADHRRYAYAFVIFISSRLAFRLDIFRRMLFRFRFRRHFSCRRFAAAVFTLASPFRWLSPVAAILPRCRWRHAIRFSPPFCQTSHDAATRDHARRRLRCAARRYVCFRHARHASAPRASAAMFAAPPRFAP